MTEGQDANRVRDGILERGAVSNLMKAQEVVRLSKLSARYPELSLRLWAESDGMHISVLLYHPGEVYGRAVEQLCDTVWQPQGVTADKVIDWAKRALEDVLGRRLQEKGE